MFLCYLDVIDFIRKNYTCGNILYIKKKLGKNDNNLIYDGYKKVNQCFLTFILYVNKIFKDLVVCFDSMIKFTLFFQTY